MSVLYLKSMGTKLQEYEKENELLKKIIEIQKVKIEQQNIMIDHIIEEMENKIKMLEKEKATKKYKYFVAWAYNNGQGCSEFIRDEKIQCIEDIKCMAKDIEKVNDIKGVVILNFIEWKGDKE